MTVNETPEYEVYVNGRQVDPANATAEIAEFAQRSALGHIVDALVHEPLENADPADFSHRELWLALLAARDEIAALKDAGAGG
jgi:hypothetical protein